MGIKEQEGFKKAPSTKTEAPPQHEQHCGHVRRGRAVFNKLQVSAGAGIRVRARVRGAWSCLEFVLQRVQLSAFLLSEGSSAALHLRRGEKSAEQQHTAPEALLMAGLVP